MVSRIIPKPVGDSSVIKFARRSVNQMVERPNRFLLEWLSSHHWAVIPVPDAIDIREAEWIAEAAQEMGHASGYAVNTESELPSDVYEFDFTQEGVLGVRFEFSLQCHLMIPKDLSFGILQSFGEFYIVAGSKPFVRKAVGVSFSTARELFLYYADQWNAPNEHKMNEILHSMAKLYEHFNGD